MTKEEYKEQLERLEKRLAEFSSIAVAFSGGVDSTFLLAMAKRVKPQQLVAITASAQFVPEREILSARRIARSLGVRHIVLEVDILKDKKVASNPPERCYYCKKQMFSLIREAAAKSGITSLMHAVNLDDLKDYRPGLKASDELGFISPLVDSGFTKDDIRQASKRLGLETWDKPSQSCLATRIPYHEEIKAEKLQMVDRAEAFLQDLGFLLVRVRCHGTSARIEVEQGLLEKIMANEMRTRISKKFQEIGFSITGIDIDGYKTGKMNDTMNGMINGMISGVRSDVISDTIDKDREEKK